MPLVGPGEDECTGTAFREYLAHLPVQHLSLPLQPISTAVKPNFRHHEWLVTRQVLKASKIRLESLPRLQINVEAREVHERQIEVLGGRIVYVRHERPGFLTLCNAVEAPEPLFDPAPAVPAHNLCGNLVAYKVGNYGRVSSAAPYSVSYRTLDSPSSPVVIKESDVLLPWNPNENVQPKRRREVEQPPRRDRICTDSIDVRFHHAAEVRLNNFRRWEHRAVRLRPECPIGDSPEI